MRTEFTLTFSLDIATDRMKQLVTDTVCNEMQGLLAQITMVSKGKVRTKLTVENNDIGVVEVDPITGLDKAEQL